MAPKKVGRYELQEEIGRGGMGVVFKAKQVDLDRLVALKMIDVSKQASPADLQRFRAEAAGVLGMDQRPNTEQKSDECENRNSKEDDGEEPNNKVK